MWPASWCGNFEEGMGASKKKLGYAWKSYAREFATKFVFQLLLEENKSMITQLREDPAVCAREVESFAISYEAPDEEHAGNRLSSKARARGLEMIQKVVVNFDQWEEVIASHLKSSWKLSSVGKMDHALLLVGICEMREWNTPREVVISEMIKLAKKYGTEGSQAFINGVLDAAARRRT